MEPSQASSTFTEGPWGRAGLAASEESIKLIPKIRPSTTPSLPDYVQYVGHKALSLAAPGAENALWDFDFVASPHTRQSSFFRVAGRPMADHFLAFYNAAIIAYGQTGSGKTHTMLGTLPSGRTARGGAGGGGGGGNGGAAAAAAVAVGVLEDMPQNAGLIPRVLHYIFQRIAADGTLHPGPQLGPHGTGGPVPAPHTILKQGVTATAAGPQRAPAQHPILPAPACGTPVAAAAARTRRNIPTPTSVPRGGGACFTPSPPSPGEGLLVAPLSGPPEPAVAGAASGSGAVGALSCSRSGKVASGSGGGAGGGGVGGGGGCGTTQYLVKASMLQIYQEVVTDLLNPRPTRLQLRETMQGGVTVVGLSEVTVRSAAEALQLLRLGASHRAVAETASNPVSSRSHCIFTLHVEAKNTLEAGVTRIRRARLQLVDLAGSERSIKGGTDYASTRQKETNAINRSLSTLCLVIARLSDRTRSQGPVPYRDSKLTFLLQDCLGGNAKTLIIANLNPSPACASETNMTLGFALRAKRVRNRAVVNEDRQGDAVVLQGEVRRLKEELSIFRTLHAEDAPPKGLQQLSAWRDQAAARASELHTALELNSELEGRLEVLEAAHNRLRREHAALEEQCEAQRCEMSAMEATVEQCEDELLHLRTRPTLEKYKALEQQLQSATRERDTATAQCRELSRRHTRLQAEYDELEGVARQALVLRHHQQSSDNQGQGQEEPDDVGQEKPLGKQGEQPTTASTTTADDEGELSDEAETGSRSSQGGGVGVDLLMFDTTTGQGGLSPLGLQKVFAEEQARRFLALEEAHAVLVVEHEQLTKQLAAAAVALASYDTAYAVELAAAAGVQLESRSGGGEGAGLVDESSPVSGLGPTLPPPQRLSTSVFVSGGGEYCLTPPHHRLTYGSATGALAAVMESPGEGYEQEDDDTEGDGEDTGARVGSCGSFAIRRQHQQHQQQRSCTGGISCVLATGAACAPGSPSGQVRFASPESLVDSPGHATGGLQGNSASRVSASRAMSPLPYPMYGSGAAAAAAAGRYERGRRYRADAADSDAAAASLASAADTCRSAHQPPMSPHEPGDSVRNYRSAPPTFRLPFPGETDCNVTAANEAPLPLRRLTSEGDMASRLGASGSLHLSGIDRGFSPREEPSEARSLGTLVRVNPLFDCGARQGSSGGSDPRVSPDYLGGDTAAVVMAAAATLVASTAGTLMGGGGGNGLVARRMRSTGSVRGGARGALLSDSLVCELPMPPHDDQMAPQSLTPQPFPQQQQEQQQQRPVSWRGGDAAAAPRDRALCEIQVQATAGGLAPQPSPSASVDAKITGLYTTGKTDLIAASGRAGGAGVAALRQQHEHDEETTPCSNRPFAAGSRVVLRGVMRPAVTAAAGGGGFTGVASRYEEAAASGAETEAAVECASPSTPRSLAADSWREAVASDSTADGAASAVETLPGGICGRDDDNGDAGHTTDEDAVVPADSTPRLRSSVRVASSRRGTRHKVAPPSASAASRAAPENDENSLCTAFAVAGSYPVGGAAGRTRGLAEAAGQAPYVTGISAPSPLSGTVMPTVRGTTPVRTPSSALIAAAIAAAPQAVDLISASPAATCSEDVGPFLVRDSGERRSVARTSAARPPSCGGGSSRGSGSARSNVLGGGSGGAWPPSAVVAAGRSLGMDEEEAGRLRCDLSRLQVLAENVAQLEDELARRLQGEAQLRRELQAAVAEVQQAEVQTQVLVQLNSALVDDVAQRDERLRGFEDMVARLYGDLKSIVRQVLQEQPGTVLDVFVASHTTPSHAPAPSPPAAAADTADGPTHAGSSCNMAADGNNSGVDAGASASPMPAARLRFSPADEEGGPSAGSPPLLHQFPLCTTTTSSSAEGAPSQYLTTPGGVALPEGGELWALSPSQQPSPGSRCADGGGRWGRTPGSFGLRSSRREEGELEVPSSVLAAGLMKLVAALKNGLIDRVQHVTQLEEQLVAARTRLEAIERDMVCGGDSADVEQQQGQEQQEWEEGPGLMTAAEARAVVVTTTAEKEDGDDEDDVLARACCAATSPHLERPGTAPEQSTQALLSTPNHPSHYHHQRSASAALYSTTTPVPTTTATAPSPSPDPAREASLLLEASLRAQLQNREAQVLDLLDRTEQLQTSLQAVLVDRDKRVADLQSQAARLAASLQAQLASRDTQIAELQRQAADLDGQLRAASSDAARCRQQAAEAEVRAERCGAELRAIEYREQVLMGQLRQMEALFTRRGEEVAAVREELAAAADQLVSMRVQAVAAQVEAAAARQSAAALQDTLDDLRRNMGFHTHPGLQQQRLHPQLQHHQHQHLLPSHHHAHSQQQQLQQQQQQQQQQLRLSYRQGGPFASQQFQQQLLQQQYRQQPQQHQQQPGATLHDQQAQAQQHHLNQQQHRQSHAGPFHAQYYAPPVRLVGSTGGAPLEGCWQGAQDPNAAAGGAYVAGSRSDGGAAEGHPLSFQMPVPGWSQLEQPDRDQATLPLPYPFGFAGAGAGAGAVKAHGRSSRPLAFSHGGAPQAGKAGGAQAHGRNAGGSRSMGGALTASQEHAGVNNGNNHNKGTWVQRFLCRKGASADGSPAAPQITTILATTPPKWRPKGMTGIVLRQWVPTTTHNQRRGG